MSFPQIPSPTEILSPAADREELHQRDYLFQGFRRKDGLYDIEGRIVDRKFYSFPNVWRGRIEKGTPLHDMAARLTIDGDYRIHAIEVTTKASPFAICPDILPNFQRLVGVPLTRGWSKILAERVGGVEGCTHIVELLRLMATIAFQTLAGEDRKRASEEGSKQAKPRTGFIDSCHALASDGDVVREHWPDFHQPPT